MKKAVILTAFGSTTDARSCYAQLQHKLELLHPECDFFWCYSSRVVARALAACGDESLCDVGEQIKRLQEMGYAQIIVQSLHLFPGSEFHKICRECGEQIALGKPLLHDEADYHVMAEIYRQHLPKDQPILFIGHGTAHASWPSYYAIESIFRAHLGENLWVGVVEKSPERPELLDSLTSLSSLLLVPLFLLRGIHYRRDIWGQGDSWQQRLSAKGVRCEQFSSAVIELSGVEQLVSRHITIALG